MAPKTTLVRDLAGQLWMTSIRIVIDVTGEASTAAVLDRIQAVSPLVLTEVTTGAQFSEQGIGGRVPQVSKVGNIVRCPWLIHHLPGHMNHTLAGAHEALQYIGHLFWMAGAAGLLRVGKVSRETE